jgi:rhamnose transport system permease protein
VVRDGRASSFSGAVDGRAVDVRAVDGKDAVPYVTEGTTAAGSSEPLDPGRQTLGGTRGASRLKAVVRWEGGLVLCAVAVLVLGISVSPAFLSSSNLLNMGLSNGEISIMALPMTLIVISGEIDLSVASTLGLSSSMIGYLWLHGWPMPGIIATVLVMGLVLGGINGVLVTRFGLPSLAVTIGTLTLYQGVGIIVLGSTTVSNFPARYTSIGINAFPHTDMSWSTVIFVLLAVIFGIVLHATKLGRSIFAIGANKDAAIYAGIRVKRIKTGLFVLSGVVCALAGVLYTFRLSTAEYDNGSGLELNVVAIVLLAGVSIFGGTGTMIGVVLSALVFAAIQNALFLTSFPQEALGVVIGALLLVSVVAPKGNEFLGRIRLAVSSLRPGR